MENSLISLFSFSLYNYKCNREERRKKLEGYLPKKHIKVIGQASDWKSAVLLASQPLLKEKLITQEYIDNMIASVHEHGPYMVLTDYFALMHAKAGVGVNEQSMSLLVTKSEVDMEGKPIKIFLVLAAKDATSHLAALSQVMEVFMDDDVRETIMLGDKETIVNIFN